MLQKDSEYLLVNLLRHTTFNETRTLYPFLSVYLPFINQLFFTGTNGQLPTYILFENATEIVRFPEIGFESKPSHPPITKVLLL